MAWPKTTNSSFPIADWHGLKLQMVLCPLLSDMTENYSCPLTHCWMAWPKATDVPMPTAKWHGLNNKGNTMFTSMEWSEVVMGRGGGGEEDQKCKIVCLIPAVVFKLEHIFFHNLFTTNLVITSFCSGSSRG